MFVMVVVIALPALITPPVPVFELMSQSLACWGVRLGFIEHIRATMPEMKAVAAEVPLKLGSPKPFDKSVAIPMPGAVRVTVPFEQEPQLFVGGLIIET